MPRLCNASSARIADRDGCEVDRIQSRSEQESAVDNTVSSLLPNRLFADNSAAGHRASVRPHLVSGAQRRVVTRMGSGPAVIVGTCATRIDPIVGIRSMQVNSSVLASVVVINLKRALRSLPCEKHMHA